MSLVNYASSSEDESELKEKEDNDDAKNVPALSTPVPSQSVPSLVLFNKNSSVVSHQKSYDASSSSPSTKELPNAALLLDSEYFPSHDVINGDHFSRITAAKKENASRKRELNVPFSSYPPCKHTRNSLQHSKDKPDSLVALLIPPQLRGRSNIVTEDVSKLFVQKH